MYTLALDIEMQDCGTAALCLTVLVYLSQVVCMGPEGLPFSAVDCLFHQAFLCNLAVS